MSSLEDSVPDVAIPKDWRPFSEQIGQIGSAIVKIPRPNATKEDLLVTAGFDPKMWTIKGSVHTRKWMLYNGDWSYYYKFEVQEGCETDEARQANVEEIVQFLTRPRLRAVRNVNLESQGAFCFLASDWQIGKAGEAGGGTAETAQKVSDAVDRAVRRVKDLRRIGVEIPDGALVGTGDIVENCTGFYSNQPFLIDLNRRDQARVSRMLITYAIDQLAPIFDKFTVATVGGNHGQNRENGKVVTDSADNDDVSVFECVKEATDRAGSLLNLNWHIPTDEMSFLLSLGGVPVGFTHGHLFNGGGKMVQAKALEWWKGQTFGLQPVSTARVLVSSHFHHFSAIDHGGRTHIQTPAADPGSQWYTESSGMKSVSGVLTLRFDNREPLGWADPAIL